VVYQGSYGPWSIEQEDLEQVYGYRAGLSVAALGELRRAAGPRALPAEALATDAGRP
jgi:uncharacterized integral membrane protein